MENMHIDVRVERFNSHELLTSYFSFSKLAPSQDAVSIKQQSFTQIIHLYEIITEEKSARS